MSPAQNTLTRSTTHNVPRLCSSHKQVRRHPLLRRRGRAADVREGEGRLTNRPSGARPNLDKGQGRGGENTSGVWSLSREPGQFHTLISLLGLQPASLDNLTSCFHTTVELKIMHQVEVLHLSVSSRIKQSVHDCRTLQIYMQNRTNSTTVAQICSLKKK